MVIDRRSFLRLVGCVSAGSILHIDSVAELHNPKLFFSARDTLHGEHRVSGFTETGNLVLDIQLPERGHSFAVHPEEPLVAHFGRRPGRFALIVEYANNRISHRIAPPENRHFNGHGVFNADGTILYATENDFDNERGVIGVYDAANNYLRLGELESYGIGPHDIRILSDGQTLVVANGGIHTHPELPRLKLNIPTMSPALCYIDRNDGTLVSIQKLESKFHQLSIRHLSVAADDSVGIAMQYEGAKGNLVQLAGLHRLDSANDATNQNAIRLLDAPVKVLRAMKHYCGSICIDSTTGTIAVSAPRGDLVVFWDLVTAQFLAALQIPDSSGIEFSGSRGEIVATSGQGDLYVLNGRNNDVNQFRNEIPNLDSCSWDNHLVSVKAGPLAAG